MKILKVLIFLSLIGGLVNGLEIIPIIDRIIGVEGDNLTVNYLIRNDINSSIVKISFYEFQKPQFFTFKYSESSLELKPGEEKNLNITIIHGEKVPLEVEVPLDFFIDANFFNGSSEVLKITFFLKFKKGKLTPSKPMIKDVLIQPILSQNSGTKINLVVENPNTEPINEVLVIYEIIKDGFKIIEGNKTFKNHIAFTERNVLFDVNLSYYSESGFYLFRAQALNNGSSLGWFEKSFNIGEASLFNVSTENFFNIWNREYVLKIKNDGNSKGVESFRISIPPLDNLLGSSSSEYVTKEGNDLIFNVEVDVGEEVVIIYRANYLFLLLIPLIMVLIFFIYKRINRDIQILRKITLLKSDIAEVSYKVLIQFKNVSNKDITDIKVIETVLPFVKKIGSTTTSKPKIVKSGFSKTLIWEYDRLYSEDQVIITYKIVTGMGVFGKIFIPGTKIEYKVDGKMKTVRTGFNRLLGVKEE